MINSRESYSVVPEFEFPPVVRVFWLNIFNIFFCLSRKIKEMCRNIGHDNFLSRLSLISLYNHLVISCYIMYPADKASLHKPRIRHRRTRRRRLRLWKCWSQRRWSWVSWWRRRRNRCRMMTKEENKESQVCLPVSMQERDVLRYCKLITRHSLLSVKENISQRAANKEACC
jgi:hypothetical protein